MQTTHVVRLLIDAYSNYSPPAVFHWDSRGRVPFLGKRKASIALSFQIQLSRAEAPGFDRECECFEEKCVVLNALLRTC
jgi:hypothetical protein